MCSSDLGSIRGFAAGLGRRKQGSAGERQAQAGRQTSRRANDWQREQAAAVLAGRVVSTFRKTHKQGSARAAAAELGEGCC